MNKLKLISIVLVLSVMHVSLAGASADSEAKVYFISPQNGDIVTSPVTIKFGLTGMGVAPAGIDRDGTGHHHLLIDVDQLPDPSLPVPADEHHRHFGGGQTETTIELQPGDHSLQLLLGDWMQWRSTPPVVVLEPERDYEGGTEALAPSARGLIMGPVQQLRDPAVYVEGDDIYLVYSVAGEYGLALARVRID